MTHPKQVACPTCSTFTPWSPKNPFRPFCSERCKLIDLGEWASESHRIAGDKIDPNEPSEGDASK